MLLFGIRHLFLRQCCTSRLFTHAGQMPAALTWSKNPHNKPQYTGIALRWLGMDGFITVFQTSALPTVMSCCDFESNGVCNLNGNEAAPVVCVCVCAGECSLC